MSAQDTILAISRNISTVIKGQDQAIRLLLSAFIIAVTWVALPWLDVRGIAPLLAIGLGWVALTLVFEFSFGLWQGKSWPVLLEAYTLKGGNIWPVVLLITALAPYIAARLRGGV